MQLRITRDDSSMVVGRTMKMSFMFVDLLIQKLLVKLKDSPVGHMANFQMPI